ncbi:hemoblobin-interacting domain-containing protein [Brevibacillus reuszeri]|uniref:hemoblobin-interacting domain-containing protein n=1 Tax=Brevibacillus reuszeri TaxID=54915 RepID=UPI003D1B1916
MPPTITPDTTDNDSSHLIELTFTDDVSWREALTGFQIDNGPILPFSATEPGLIRFTRLSPGTHTIKFFATGYSVAEVTQVINPS